VCHDTRSGRLLCAADPIYDSQVALGQRASSRTRLIMPNVIPRPLA
jgi:hypothetical protein